MTTTVTERRPRADASRNRERIIAAARDLVVERGPEVPFDQIADRAGVANATLYRHFEDRQALLREVAMSSLERIADLAEGAPADEPDAFTAVERFAHQAADERIGSMSPLLCQGFDRSDPRIATARERLETAVETLMDRARTAGLLRHDVHPGDLMVAITQLARPVAGTMCTAIDRYAHRHLQLFLDGLRTPPRSTLPGVAATFEDMTS